MRLSITLFMLSAASIVMARCGICPEEIKEHEVVYDLLLNDADSNETFCGYACMGLFWSKTAHVFVDTRKEGKRKTKIKGIAFITSVSSLKFDCIDTFY
jgi:hypothetical protein